MLDRAHAVIQNNLKSGHESVRSVCKLKRHNENWKSHSRTRWMHAERCNW